MLHLLEGRECTHHSSPCLNLPGALLNFQIEIEIKRWKVRFALEFLKRETKGIWIGAAHLGCVIILCFKTISLICFLANLLVGLWV